MKLLRFLPLAGLGLIVAELASIIVIGRVAGLLATLVLLIADAVVGIAVIRGAGLGLAATLGQARADTGFASGRAASAFLQALAGLLLIVPGFLSDAVAILLLVPALRTLLASRMMAKAARGAPSEDRERWREGPIIEGEATEVDVRQSLPPSRGSGAETPGGPDDS